MVCCLPSAAQTFRGGIFGTIEDTAGKRVAAAKVVVYPVESPSVRRTVTSNSAGEFRIEDLLPGAYAITIRAA
ncbi:MAG TPA: carboxypeptidase-like regulatory domain-containing protein, partial [Candidatus Acidoferrales bacterium]|nr:carboxypeptidase-like regulatory domain-containing protein [Candidatus Acidoferrales bacterium]